MKHINKSQRVKRLCKCFWGSGG